MITMGSLHKHRLVHVDEQGEHRVVVSTEDGDVTLEWSNADEGVARMCEQLREQGRLKARPAKE